MPITAADPACAGHPLETERLILRAPERADAPAIAALIGEWEVARYTANIPHPYVESDAHDWLGKLEESVTEMAFALTLRETGEFMGDASLRLDREANEGVLGYWLGRAYWGRGFMTEAVIRLLRFAFEECALASVRAGVVPENRASAAVLVKAGLTRVGSATEPAPARGGAQQVDVYRIVRADWLRQHALPVVLVSAVALLDTDDRVLLAERPDGKPMAGLWEFPGGKVGSGETPEASLIRELHEELGVEIRESCLAPLTFASHRYSDFHLLMPLFVCRVWDGTPTAREGQRLAWVRVGLLKDYPMPPADIPLVAALRDLI
ncbi:MAG: bifunctional GNAT family N-acetyltransferase/(deoxy)nucleoside triphosphate pyrophosphohydrolase [Alphaproteobacteria bacterium]